MLFQTKHQVPDIYTTESRDFQLLESVLDVLCNAIINNSTGISYLRYPLKTNSEILQLLCGYVGFFPTEYYPDELLRSIVLNFSSLIKLKGTLQSIELAIKALQSAYTNRAQVRIFKNTGSDVEDPFKYTIQISQGSIVNQIYIDDLLRYLRPVGIIFSDVLFSPQDLNTYTSFLITDVPYTGLQTTGSSTEAESTSNYLYGQIRRSNNISDDITIGGQTELGKAFPNVILSGVSHTPIVRTRSFVQQITETRES